MAQGNALTRKTNTEEPIIFSEWKPLPKGKVQRTEYTFDSIVEGGNATGTVQSEFEQLDLFAEPDNNPEEAENKSYAPCLWEDIYNKKIE